MRTSRKSITFSRRAFLRMTGISAASLVSISGIPLIDVLPVGKAAVLAQPQGNLVTTIYGGPIKSPGKRPCCMLSDDRPLPKFISNDNIVEIDDLSIPHEYGTGSIIRMAIHPNEVGIIYSCSLGFIDLGHLRDLADLTFYYFKQIAYQRKNKSGAKLKLFAYEGEVTLRKDILESEYVDVACRMAYDESIFHEIETYWNIKMGCHHSSFSPEDLVSNTLGTYVAKLAIISADISAGMSEKTFSRHVTRQLPTFLKRFVLTDKAGTKEALSRVRVEFKWIAGGDTDTEYLHRRNFGSQHHADMWPGSWRVPGLSFCNTPQDVDETEWRPPLIGPPQDFYTARYRFPVYDMPSVLYIKKRDGEYLNNTDFLYEIYNIRLDAKSRYGTGYDNPL